MPGIKPLEVFRFGTFKHDTSAVPHRHQYDMLLWTSKGKGLHKIDFKEYEMLPGRLFIIRQGQVHQVESYAEDGWMILVQDQALQHISSKIWNSFYNRPFIDFSILNCDIFLGIFSMLQIESRNPKPEIRIIENLLNAMLICLEREELPVQENYTLKELDLMSRLRALIEENYVRHKEPDFYCAKLGYTPKRLNELARSVLGKTVYQMIQEKLLLESRAFLSSTKLSVKEIAYELGFEDPAYFCRFFKRETGTTPKVYRLSAEC
ncbi:MAG: helix-turn-helix domain-containing protein [Chitinophagaceae bacterium]|nr:helix-turn-helix domain-containing protein [Chitinophagaceae bacterium]